MSDAPDPTEITDRKRPDPARYGEERSQALRTTADEVGFGDRGDVVYGVLMDRAFGGGFVVTLVTFGDGSTSLLTTIGVGVTGAGANADVAAESAKLLDEVERSRSLFSAGWDDGPLGDGLVRMIILTPSGSFAASAPSDELFAKGHALSKAFLAAVELLRVTRAVSGV
jgi:hypothetical protein